MAQTISIKEQLSGLVQLQDLDGKIYALAKQKERFPLEIAKSQKSFEDKKIILNGLEEKFKNLAVKRKEREGDLASKEENIKKLNAQLAGLKTNKEYHAMQGQIAGLKADNSLIEEDILKMMEEQDKGKVEIAAEKVRLSEEEKKFLEEKKEAEAGIKEIEAAINDLAAKRGHILPSIDKHILPVYERILKGKEGLALVKVKDYSCQGCFMSVTPQVVNEIKMLDKIVICEACARILYIEEDL